VPSEASGEVIKLLLLMTKGTPSYAHNHYGAEAPGTHRKMNSIEEKQWMYKKLSNGRKHTQEWNAYNKAQTNEKLIFMKLLKDLCENLEQPRYKFGRPTLPFSDMLFGSVMKTYTGFSLRRFMSDMKIAKEFGLVGKVPCYSSLSNFMNKEGIKEILEQLITISSLPLKEVEEDFAIDSSGFSTSRFARWFDYKWGRKRNIRFG